MSALSCYDKSPSLRIPVQPVKEPSAVNEFRLGEQILRPVVNSENGDIILGMKNRIAKA